MHWPTTFDEYVAAFDVVPTTPDAYLRRFVPGFARENDWRMKLPAECSQALREAVRAARRPGGSTVSAGRGWHYTSSGSALAPSRPAPVRRSPSPAVRVAGPITEVRRSSSSPGTIAGYAAMFNRPSVPINGFIETLAPSAFRSTLQRVANGEHDVLALTEHDTKNLLGRMSARNLTLTEDSVGLRFVLELPDTQLGRDVRELVGRGILRGMSFSFSVVRESWAKGDGGRSRRTVHDLTMYEVSVVGSPAYPSTSVSATRSARCAKDDVFWTASRLRAVAARPTRGAAAIAVTRSTPDREWR
jgi:hypothetical protein